MMLVVATDPVPLRTDSDGVVRIGDSRVTLDTIVTAWREGMTAESIVEQYPVVSLAQIYSVLGYVLNHIVEIDAYLSARNQQGMAVRQENEARFPPYGIRERLLQRKKAI